MRKFRGRHEDPGRPDAPFRKRRSRLVLTGGLLAGGLVVGAAGLAGVGATTGGDLASFDVGRLASIVASPGHDRDGKGPKGAPEQSPKGEDSAGTGTESAGGETSGWKYGPDGCESGEGKGEPSDPEEDGSAGKDPKVEPEPSRDAKGMPTEEGSAGSGKRPGGYRDDWDPRCGSDAGGRHHKVLRVPCDPDELIAALVHANAVGGATLQLAPECTYTLTAYGEHEGRHEDHDGRDNIWTGVDAVDGNAVDGSLLERSGLPLIYQPIRIKGEGATITRPVHAAEFRFFTVRDGGELKLSDVTLENGRAADGGSIKVEFGGAAVIERTEITQSVADSPYGGGGAIFNDGRVTLVESKLSDNSAAGVAGRGGGILNGGVLTAEKSEFVNNSANGYGGGVANHRATADVSQSSLADNTAAEGGGMASYSSRTKVWDSKVAHNTATFGGGLSSKEGTLTVRHLKINGNIGLGDGGGIATAGGLAVIDDSLVKGNTTFGNGGGVLAQRANLIVRGTEITRNDAVGPESVGGGIALEEGKLALFDSRVTENEATNAPGGIFAADAEVEVDERTVIIANRPTNCEGSPAEIPNCFG